MDGIARAALTLLVAASLLGDSVTEANAQVAPTSAPMNSIIGLAPYIAEASQRFSVPEAWIRAVILAESGGRIRVDGRPIVSVAGAIGPMQLMPETYRELAARYRLGEDSSDPEQNILAGSAYLHELYLRYGLPGMLAAYNAGPARYEAYRNLGISLPAETQSYLMTLKDLAPAGAMDDAVVAAARLLFPLDARSRVDPVAAPQQGTGPLFVPLAPGL